MPSDQNQTCKSCGRRDKFNFHIPDETWAKVVPIELDGKVVCLSCFDDLAVAQGISYADKISEVCFVGDGATIIFSIANALS